MHDVCLLSTRKLEVLKAHWQRQPCLHGIAFVMDGRLVTVQNLRRGGGLCVREGVLEV